MGNAQLSPRSITSPAEWRAPHAAGPVDDVVTVPGSQALTYFEIVLAASAEGPSQLMRPLHSDFLAGVIETSRALGVDIREVAGTGPFGPDLVVDPPAALVSDAVVSITEPDGVAPVAFAVAGRASGSVTVKIHESPSRRPMGEVIQVLRSIGCDINDAGKWTVPVTVRGRGHIRGGHVEIDVNRSSQLASTLLLAAPRFDVGLTLRHVGQPLGSLPDIDMTVEALRRRGVYVDQPTPTEWIVPGGPVRARDVTIEPDLSLAAPFVAAAMIAGGRVSVPGWPAHSAQPAARLAEILVLMGARARRRGGALTVTAGAERIIRRACVDVSEISELTPILAALAAFADGPSTFTGLKPRTGNQSTHIDALVDNLRAIGGEVEELPDGIRVVPRPLSGGVWRADHDYHVATAGALIGLAVPGVTVEDIGSATADLPEYTKMWEHLVRGSRAR
ncbi:3-phosphoshikimate 1-carboxyvinyltransferase [Microbacterium sp. zg.Y625]|uniref:3-phosphoshikimate 1-carboxyvinyltransferase n=1 Tax=Microbacterium jiangjiandongii TaxID=3049071 RepID=UPI00214B4234|nr:MULTISPECIES: 3-phosphoshikimate 1-carboxyvinyltransferase [unclassified Microbacterium]MCR2791610.1 3-phosphoshikimate 1-carboxyvinyltransferase [Microbacterium sp. zg.Y625]WIM24433.1 3-phosphoshikimate 1-carboxyvinyltransferase [Microbacterium sp. zg-Y625]